jgi:hypothetical protein
MKTSLTNLWDCMPTGRALAGKALGQIQNPRLSVLAAVATDLLERHTEEADWTGGFVARFLTFFAEPERAFVTPPMDDLGVKRSLSEWLRGLADGTTPLETGEAASIPGMCDGLTPRAQEMWADWAADEARKASGANTRVTASIARATSHAGKVAILLAWDIGRARSGDRWQIGESELRSALAITSLHIKSVLELGDRVTGSRDMRDRRAVLMSVSDLRPTPLGVVIKKANLLKRRVVEILDSLTEEQSVSVVSVAGRASYLRTPDQHRLLVASVDDPGLAAEPLALAPPPTVEKALAPKPAPVAQPTARPGQVVWGSAPGDDDEPVVIFECDEPPALNR